MEAELLKQFPRSYGCEDSIVLQELLKPYHTSKASILAYAASENLITDEQYQNNTFSIMVRVRTVYPTTSRVQSCRPIILSIHEDDGTDDRHCNFSKDLQRIFVLHQVPSEKKVVFKSGSGFGDCEGSFGKDNEPLLRLLKARGGRDTIVVNIEPGRVEPPKYSEMPE